MSNFTNVVALQQSSALQSRKRSMPSNECPLQKRRKGRTASSLRKRRPLTKRNPLKICPLVEKIDCDGRDFHENGNQPLEEMETTGQDENKESNDTTSLDILARRECHDRTDKGYVAKKKKLLQVFKPKERDGITKDSGNMDATLNVIDCHIQPDSLTEYERIELNSDDVDCDKTIAMQCRDTSNHIKLFYDDVDFKNQFDTQRRTRRRPRVKYNKHGERLKDEDVQSQTKDLDETRKRKNVPNQTKHKPRKQIQIEINETNETNETNEPYTRPRKRKHQLSATETEPMKSERGPAKTETEPAKTEAKPTKTKTARRKTTTPRTKRTTSRTKTTTPRTKSTTPRTKRTTPRTKTTAQRSKTTTPRTKTTTQTRKTTIPRTKTKTQTDETTMPTIDTTTPRTHTKRTQKRKPETEANEFTRLDNDIIEGFDFTLPYNAMMETFVNTIPPMQNEIELPFDELLESFNPHLSDVNSDSETEDKILERKKKSCGGRQGSDRHKSRHTKKKGRPKKIELERNILENNVPSFPKDYDSHKKKLKCFEIFTKHSKTFDIEPIKKSKWLSFGDKLTSLDRILSSLNRARVVINGRGLSLLESLYYFVKKDKETLISFLYKMSCIALSLNSVKQKNKSVFGEDHRLNHSDIKRRYEMGELGISSEIQFYWFTLLSKTNLIVYNFDSVEMKLVGPTIHVFNRQIKTFVCENTDIELTHKKPILIKFNDHHFEVLESIT